MKYYLSILLSIFVCIPLAQAKLHFTDKTIGCTDAKTYIDLQQAIKKNNKPLIDYYFDRNHCKNLNGEEYRVVGKSWRRDLTNIRVLRDNISELMVVDLAKAP